MPVITLTQAVAATVAVVPSGMPHPNFVSEVTGQPILNGSRVRVGFFSGFSDSPEFRANLAGPASVARAYMDYNFVPLGEPMAPVFSFSGMFPALGTSSTVSQSMQTSGFPGVSGGISGPSLAFITATPNVMNPAGLPRGSRLFLVAFSGFDWASAEEFAVVSATTWLVPTGVSPVVSLPMGAIDSAAEVFRGSLATNGSQKQIILAIPEPEFRMLGLSAVALLPRRRRIAPLARTAQQLLA